MRFPYLSDPISQVSSWAPASCPTRYLVLIPPPHTHTHTHTPSTFIWGPNSHSPHQPRTISFCLSKPVRVIRGYTLYTQHSCTPRVQPLYIRAWHHTHAPHTGGARASRSEVKKIWGLSTSKLSKFICTICPYRLQKLHGLELKEHLGLYMWCYFHLMVMQATWTTSDMACWTCAAVGPPLSPTSRYFSSHSALFLSFTVLYLYFNSTFCSTILLPDILLLSYWLYTQHADLSTASLGSGGIFVGNGAHEGFPPWGTSFKVHGTWCRYWIPCHRFLI